MERVKNNEGEKEGRGKWIVGVGRDKKEVAG